MKQLLRAELLKQRSARTLLGLVAAMVGLVLLGVLLHSLGLDDADLQRASDQLRVFGLGEIMGVLFAALLGALVFTSEVRHGTIRPTFLVTPRRDRVVAAKVAVSSLIGAGFGLVASAVAVGATTAVLTARGIDVRLDTGDYALLIAGGAVAAALWAAIGVGVGAVVRNQVPTLIGICAWLLFVEGLLLGDVLDNAGRFLPGAAATAITGVDRADLVSPLVGLILLVIYAAVAAMVGSTMTVRRDVT
jgi:ABC-type transport system involved in multi-copper enzyme maturation permease subunit